jgi:very-short-patch-repair endonuclease
MPFEMEESYQEWLNSLLDRSNRNPLKSFKLNKPGPKALKFANANLNAVWTSLVGNDAKCEARSMRALLGLPPLAKKQPPNEGMSPAGTQIDEEPATTDLPPEAVSPKQPPAKPETADELLKRCQQLPAHSDRLLFSELDDQPMQAILNKIAKTSKELITEHGVEALYLAFGFLKWSEKPNPTEAKDFLTSPLVLLPVKLLREGGEMSWQLEYNGERSLTNRCLAEELREQFRIELPEVQSEEDKPFQLTMYLSEVSKTVQIQKHFEVLPSLALGIFNFQKLAMWQDLVDHKEQVCAQPLCRKLAGDPEITLNSDVQAFSEHQLDATIHPTQVHQILDADSSQQAAIQTVLRGANVVIDGPPGTGKSQTIANLIAELLAAKKTVLFVSEKAAALEVVKARLDANGLGDFCLNLHSNTSNRRVITAELKRCLELVPTAVNANNWRHDELAGSRAKLNDYVRELHQVREPFQRSLFLVLADLASLQEVKVSTSWKLDQPQNLSNAYYTAASEILNRLKSCKTVLDAGAQHPWHGCKLARLGLMQVDDLQNELTTIAEQINKLLASSKLDELNLLEQPANTLTKLIEASKLAKSLLALQEEFPTEWFQANPHLAAQAILTIGQSASRVRQILAELQNAGLAGLEHLGLEQLQKTLAPGVELPSGGSTRPLREAILTRQKAHQQLKDLLKRLEQLQSLLKRLQPDCLFLETQSLAQLHTSAKLYVEYSGFPAIPPGWWNAAQRKLLQISCNNALDWLTSIEELQTELAGKLSPRAFTDEATQLVNEAILLSRSLWSRWFGGWRGVRQQVQEWYRGRVPSDAELIQDLKQLKRYHQARADLALLSQQHGPDVLTDDAGRADWRETLQRLQIFSELAQRTTSQDLKAALGPGGLCQRPEFQANIKELNQTTTLFLTEWGQLSAIEPLGVLPDQLELGALAQRLLDRDAVLVQSLEAWDPVQKALSPKAEIAVIGWPKLVKTLQELATSREQIQAELRQCGSTLTISHAEGYDWSNEMAQATKLLLWIEQQKPAFTPKIVQSLTNKSQQDQLNSAVESLKPVWKAVDQLKTLFSLTEPVSGDVVLSQIPLPELAAWIKTRSQAVNQLQEWVRFQQVVQEAEQYKLTTLLNEVRSGLITLEEVTEVFQKRVLTQWYDATITQLPVMANFNGADHQENIDRFRNLDRNSLSWNRARLWNNLIADPNRPSNFTAAPESSDLGILMREINRTRGGRSLRKLFADVPKWILKLKPCLMMSPLAVSTYLASDDFRFDVIVFDEASQVKPHDAISAIYRGKQLVVAGDEKQLPPSDFFQRAVSDDEELDTTETDQGTEGFESLLNICSSVGMIQKRLNWHYRSRHEELIAFSNHHFYENKLVTFPSANAAERAIQFVHLQGQFVEGKNPREAQRVVALMLEHARINPLESLGVIAMNKAQADLIEELLQAELAKQADLKGFFSEEKQDAYFIKNLENVQGDARDVIILGITYGADASGRVPMRFGPINTAGGERRLNVAVTRAQSKMIVVTSLKTGDIDLNRTAKEGPRLLKAFLDYAETGPIALRAEVTVSGKLQFDSPFEEAVYDALTKAGLKLDTQVGCSGFRIDLAVRDPERGGSYLLGIECDGRTYHSSATARDRDRLRQSVLEGLGWRIHRIWSTDWVRNCEGEVQRVRKSLTTAPQPITFVPDPEPVTIPAAPPEPITKPEVEVERLYDKFQDVPDNLIEELAIKCLLQFGPTLPEELARAVNQTLGFERFGQRIKERILSMFQTMLLAGKMIKLDDGRLALQS